MIHPLRISDKELANIEEQFDLLPKLSKVLLQHIHAVDPSYRDDEHFQRREEQRRVHVEFKSR